MPKSNARDLEDQALRERLYARLFPDHKRLQLQTSQGPEWFRVDTEGRYDNNSTVVQILDDTGEVYCTVSVNLGGYSDLLPPGTFYVKDWSENEEVVQQLRERRVIRDANWPDAPVSNFVPPAHACTLNPISEWLDIDGNPQR